MAGRFKRFRAKHRLTQSQLGKLIGRERTEISHIENAKTYPYYSTLNAFEELEARMKG